MPFSLVVMHSVEAKESEAFMDLKWALLHKGRSAENKIKQTPGLGAEEVNSLQCICCPCGVCAYPVPCLCAQSLWSAPELPHSSGPEHSNTTQHHLCTHKNTQKEEMQHLKTSLKCSELCSWQISFDTYKNPHFHKRKSWCDIWLNLPSSSLQEFSITLLMCT